jgi:hypothetical protein
MMGSPKLPSSCEVAPFGMWMSCCPPFGVSQKIAGGNMCVRPMGSASAFTVPQGQAEPKSVQKVLVPAADH